MKTQIPPRTQITTPKISNPMMLINTHISPLALNINDPNPILKSHRLDEWIKRKKIHPSVVYKKYVLALKIDTTSE